MTTLSPFVYWAQDEWHIFLKVDLVDAAEPSVKLESKNLDFSAIGSGAQGRKNYQFALGFYDNIDTEKTTNKINANCVTFSIKKSQGSWWPRLVSQPKKPHWLKIDFERWKSQDDMNEEKVGDIRNHYPGLYDKLMGEELGVSPVEFKKVFMTLYNLFMFVGFLYVAIVLCTEYLKHGPDCYPDIYNAVGGAMYVLQMVQCAEIVFPIIGYLQGGVLMPFLQIGGRAFILYIMIDLEPRIKVQPVVFLLFLAWSSIEVIRYPYYISQIYKIDMKLLTWMRYTAWMLCYPVGFLCEVVICYKNVHWIDESQKWSVTMPNTLNFTLNFATCLRIYLLFITTPGFIVLILHMLGVRKQKLSPKSKTK